MQILLKNPQLKLNFGLLTSEAVEFVNDKVISDFVDKVTSEII